MTERCLLAVYAHPDDEAFSVAGTFRALSDAGVKTALVCATRGELGTICDPALATRDTLGQVRERELRAACRLTGVADLTFLGYPDGSLEDVDVVEAVGLIVRQIRRLRPQVVVTFDANGDYGHSDHMAIHRLTVEAFHKAGDPGWYPEHLADRLQPFAPRKLYAHAMARGVMSRVFRQLSAGGSPPAPGGSAATIPISDMGTPDEAITISMPLATWPLAAKMAAMQAHRTQLDPGGPFYHFPSGAVREWLGTERFRRLHPTDGLIRETGLFQGLDEDTDVILPESTSRGYATKSAM